MLTSGICQVSHDSLKGFPYTGHELVNHQRVDDICALDISQLRLVKTGKAKL